jgi:hypothetical protein
MQLSTRLELELGPSNRNEHSLLPPSLVCVFSCTSAFLFSSWNFRVEFSVDDLTWKEINRKTFEALWVGLNEDFCSSETTVVVWGLPEVGRGMCTTKNILPGYRLFNDTLCSKRNLLLLLGIGFCVCALLGIVSKTSPTARKEYGILYHCCMC